MKKKTVIGLALLSTLCLQGEGGATAQAASTPKVESHAIVYVTQDRKGDQTAGLVEVIVKQQGAIRLLGCPPSEAKIPNTPEELDSFVNGFCFPIDSSWSSNDGLQQMQLRWVHQKAQGRYILLGTTLFLEPQAMTGSTMTYFELADPGSLNHVSNAIFHVDGENPKIITNRSVGLKAYDAIIQYPEITEKPIEQ